MEHFFAPCPRGLERVLCDELAAFGAHGVMATDGGVAFEGDFTLCRAANLRSRVASRVLWRVGHARYRNEQDIFEAARTLPWHDWFDVGRTIRVNLSAIRSPLKSLDFATLRVKDAVCDAFRAKTGRRPDVDTRAPDVRIHVFLTAGDMMLYLDTSGEPLFKRGYRAATGEAPLRENLAAGILHLTGWQPGTPLLDPMCGGGTFLCEAAMIAFGIAPGLARAFGFEKLAWHDRGAWRAEQGRAREESQIYIKANIYGSDLHGDALKLAHANLAALGVDHAVTLKQVNVLECSPPAPVGILVANPPYGVRLEEQQKLAAFYPQLGDVLKKKFSGWTAYLFTGDLRLAKLIGLAASKRTPLYNGALECRLFEFRLVAGSMRKGVRREA